MENKKEAALEVPFQERKRELINNLFCYVNKALTRGSQVDDLPELVGLLMNLNPEKYNGTALEVPVQEQQRELINNFFNYVNKTLKNGAMVDNLPSLIGMLMNE